MNISMISYSIHVMYVLILCYHLGAIVESNTNCTDYSSLILQILVGTIN